MAGLFELTVIILTPILMLLIGGGIGRLRERRHLRELTERERALASFSVDDLDHYAAGADPNAGGQLLVSEVVIGSDYLKTFLAGLRNLVGGEVSSFQSLLLRARREAVLRLMEEAHGMGFNALANVRLTTSEIGRMMSAIQASGTAYRRLPFPRQGRETEPL